MAKGDQNTRSVELGRTFLEPTDLLEVEEELATRTVLKDVPAV